MFDVELLGRLVYPEQGIEPTPVGAIVEVPLRSWHDVAGSKLGLRDMWHAAFDLARITRETRLRRSAGR